jgi:outer membrane exchange protein TraA
MRAPFAPQVPALFCALLALAHAGPGQAEPLRIRADQAVRKPRADAGAGLCGLAIKVAEPVRGPAFSSIDQAITQLGRPEGDAPVLRKVSFVSPLINFRAADPGSVGDFSGQATPDQYFPFADSAQATPRGDDRNFALRLRGYLNVTRAGTVTLALNGDDAARLSLAGTRVSETQEQVSSREVRQVRFEAPGLYPLEVVYYQNASVAVLELSQAEGEQPEGRPTAINPGTYALVPAAALHNARTGRSDCAQCDADATCPPGNYCGDGICQRCNTPDHCGERCEACPPLRPYCAAGPSGALRCVECTSDGHCASGLTCDVMSGSCVPGRRCSTDGDCPAGTMCDPAKGICVTPAVPCKNDDACPGGQVCDPAKGTCVPALPSCDRDHPCGPAAYCDEGGVCRPLHVRQYVGGCAASGAPRGGPAAALAGGLLFTLLCGLVLLRGRRRQGRAGAAVFFSALVVILLAPGQGAAQISINAQTFRPAIGPENIITVEGSRTPGRVVPILGLMVDYAHRPLRYRDALTGETLADTVTSMTTLHLMGGLGIVSWLSAAVDLPVVVYQGFDERTPTTDVFRPPGAAGLGDLRLVAKARMLDNSEGGFGLAFVPQISFPTGSGEALRGDSAFGFEPRLALDYRTRGRLIVALNAGFLLRTSDQVARNVRVSHQARYGAGLYVPLPRGFGLAGELIGATSVARPEDGTIYSPLEMYGAPRWTHRAGWTVQVGAGAGLLTMAGSPQFRFFAQLGYLPFGKRPPPRPEQPADPDRDRDGVLNEKDRCPDEPGLIENGGCPDRDTDKDGVIDRLDRCPSLAGPLENGGCPDSDLDGDGIVDRLDRCPRDAGPAENGGCPDRDADKDGVVDRLDNCPNQAGPAPGGCPPRKYIMVTQEKIELKQKILFATAKSMIRPASFDLLNEVVDVLRAHPTMEVRIEGHTDNRGKASYNQRLSEERAGAVRNYLIAAGIEAGRLSAVGYGMDRPIADNKTKAGREMNRRTEFLIIKR